TSPVPERRTPRTAPGQAARCRIPGTGWRSPALASRTSCTACRIRSSTVVRSVSRRRRFRPSPRLRGACIRVSVQCLTTRRPRDETRGWQAECQPDPGPLQRSALVLVVAADPEILLVASQWGAIEPLIHVPETVQPSSVGGVGMVDDAVVERERTHARPLARERGHVGSGHGRHVGDGVAPVRRLPALERAVVGRLLTPVVVFPAALPLLLLGELDV